MNIEQAKAIPLSALLGRLGFEPTRDLSESLWYLSPFRAEQTASFHVHTGKNVWYDFGAGRGGTVIDFALAYLESQGRTGGVKEALAWIREFGDAAHAYTPPSLLPKRDAEPALELRSLQPLHDLSAIRYLAERGIPQSVAEPHVQQAVIFNRSSGRNFYALAMRNEEEGLELRNRNFKGCLGTKAISFIRGAQPKPPGIHVFEGMMDFLSVAARIKDHPLADDAMILHSVSMLAEAIPYIKGYGYSTLYSWMDNDAAGLRAQEALAAFAATEEGLTHLPMNRIYAPYKDVNEWHVAHPLKGPEARP
ncbi:toprim domain-containing protein [Nostoc sp. NIES-2111]